MVPSRARYWCTTAAAKRLVHIFLKNTHISNYDFNESNISLAMGSFSFSFTCLSTRVGLSLMNLTDDLTIHDSSSYGFATDGVDVWVLCHTFSAPEKKVLFPSSLPLSSSFYVSPPLSLFSLFPPPLVSEFPLNPPLPSHFKAYSHPLPLPSSPSLTSPTSFASSSPSFPFHPISLSFLPLPLPLIM